MEKLINIYEEYIQLLTDEINELAPIANNHGWQSSRFKQGEELRKKLKI